MKCHAVNYLLEHLQGYEIPQEVINKAKQIEQGEILTAYWRGVSHSHKNLTKNFSNEEPFRVKPLEPGQYSG